jgi:hypothetical protein
MEVSTAYPEATDKATVDSTDTNFPKKEARCERRGRDFKGGGSEAERWQSATEYHGRFINGFTLAAGEPLPLGFGLSRGTSGLRPGPSTSVDTDTDHGGGKITWPLGSYKLRVTTVPFFFHPGADSRPDLQGPLPHCQWLF